MHAADLYLSPAIFEFSNPKAYKKGKGEINLPVHVVNLSSLVGVAISCLAEGVEFDHVLPKLDFYARFFRCFDYLVGVKTTKLAITMICVGFNRTAAPFWFGSSIAGNIEGANRYEDACARRNILQQALMDYKGITLPLMPPENQRRIGEFISINVNYWGLTRGNAKHAEVITKLLQLIVEPRNARSGPSWGVTSNKPPDFTDNGKTIFREAGIVCPPNLFETLKTSVNKGIRVGAGQEYGHCAETYTLIFMIKLVSFSFSCSSPLPSFSPWLSLIPLRRKELLSGKTERHCDKRFEI